MEYKLKSAVMPLVVLNLLFFILQFALPWFTSAFMLIGEDVFSRPWILLTHLFLHGGPSHIFFNMWALFLFGPLLEAKIGPNRFLAFYLGTGIIAGFISSFFYQGALGASGAIMGIIGALVILMPQLQLLFLFIVPMPLWIAGIIYALLDIFGVFFPSGTGNIAHLAGMIFGVLFGLYLKKQSKKFHKKFQRKSHLNEFDMDEYLKSGRI